MTALNRFKRTSAGIVLTSGALFVALSAAAPKAETASDVALSEMHRTSPKPFYVDVSQTASTTALRQMLEAAFEEVAAFQSDLQEQQKLTERFVRVLEVMDRLVGDVEGLFEDGLELTVQEKVETARRIITNNLVIARKLATESAADVSDVIAVSYDGQNEVQFASAYSALVSKRETLLEQLEQTRDHVTALFGEVGKLQSEVVYYDVTLQKATDLFGALISGEIKDEIALEEKFSELRQWRAEFREEMATTDDVYLTSGN